MTMRRFAHRRRCLRSLLLAGCSPAVEQDSPASRRAVNAEVGTTNDINPQDPANLRQGGNLRLALTEFPSNFNSLHIDGNRPTPAPC